MYLIHKYSLWHVYSVLAVGILSIFACSNIAHSYTSYLPYQVSPAQRTYYDIVHKLVTLLDQRVQRIGLPGENYQDVESFNIDVELFDLFLSIEDFCFEYPESDCKEFELLIHSKAIAFEGFSDQTLKEWQEKFGFFYSDSGVPSERRWGLPTEARVKLLQPRMSHIVTSELAHIEINLHQRSIVRHENNGASQQLFESFSSTFLFRKRQILAVINILKHSSELSLYNYEKKTTRRYNLPCQSLQFVMERPEIVFCEDQNKFLVFELAAVPKKLIGGLNFDEHIIAPDGSIYQIYIEDGHKRISLFYLYEKLSCNDKFEYRKIGIPFSFDTEDYPYLSVIRSNENLLIEESVCGPQGCEIRYDGFSLEKHQFIPEMELPFPGTNKKICLHLMDQTLKNCNSTQESANTIAYQCSLNNISSGGMLCKSQDNKKNYLYYTFYDSGQQKVHLIKDHILSEPDIDYLKRSVTFGIEDSNEALALNLDSGIMMKAPLTDIRRSLYSKEDWYFHRLNVGFGIDFFEANKRIPLFTNWFGEGEPFKNRKESYSEYRWTEKGIILTNINGNYWVFFSNL